jgi:holo-[acyl-carrier protein] synthase
VIVGLGIDITEVSRMREAIERRGRGLVKRVFTPAEITYCESHRDPFERFAARFAAKEAGMKALGTGWRLGVRWVDLEVVRLPSGKPTLALHGKAHEFAAKLGVINISLTITHTGNSALAQVIFEG